MSNCRHRRLRSVLWEEELTELVTQEAHDLRNLRKKVSGFEWHVDHIIPLSSFDLTIEDEVKKACHYTNLQPLVPQNKIMVSNL